MVPLTPGKGKECFLVVGNETLKDIETVDFPYYEVS